MNKKQAVVIIPIYHPDDRFCQLLDMLKRQEKQDFDVYIIDSGSDMDLYASHLEGLSWQIVQTTPQKFNHGGTRAEAAQANAGYPFLIYMTQDAVPADAKALGNLLAVFQDSDVGCAYGRQLPNPNAGVLGAHARLFNYPAQSQVKTLADAKWLGIKAAFISDTFAAYRIKALAAVGGFPKEVILSEDTYVAARMLLAGWKSVYCAEAQVYHSHDYSIMQEFRRYFDTGVFHAREPWIRKSFGQAEGEGKRFVLSEMKYILQYAPYLLLSAVIRDGMKFLGYRLGIMEGKLPVWLKRTCSMNQTYWSNKKS